MKKFLVLCLLVAIGAVGFIEKSQAQDMRQFCMSHPGAPGCQGQPHGGRGHGNPNQPHPPGGPRPPFFHGQPQGHGPDFGGDGRFHHRPGDWQPFVGFQLFVDPGYPAPSYCDALANSLSRQGFRILQELKCSGGTYIYLARRDGELINLYVSTATGRITAIRPAY